MKEPAKGFSGCLENVVALVTAVNIVCLLVAASGLLSMIPPVLPEVRGNAAYFARSLGVWVGAFLLLAGLSITVPNWRRLPASFRLLLLLLPVVLVLLALFVAFGPRSL